VELSIEVLSLTLKTCFSMHIIQFFVTQLVVKPDPTGQLVWRMPDGREFDLQAGHI